MSEPLQPLSFARRAVRGAVWTGASQYLLFAVGLIKAVVLARLVDRELFGIVAGTTVWASYLTVTRLDLRLAALNSREERAALDTQFLLENVSTAASFPLAALIMIVWRESLPPPGWALLFVLLGAAQFEALTSTSVYLTEKRMRQDVLARLTIVSALVGPALAVALAMTGRPWEALALDAVWPVIIPRLGAAIFAGWRPRLGWHPEYVRAQLRLGWTMWGTGMLGKITFQFDDWLVFNLRRPHPSPWRATGADAEALYDRAYSVSKLPMDLAAGMIASNALAIYTDRASHGREHLVPTYRRLTWLLAWIICAASAYLFAAVDELVLVLGDQWVPMVPLVRLTILFTVGRPLLQNCAQVLYALGHERDVRRAFLVQAIFLVAVGPAAVFYQGAAGAAVVVSVMSVVGLVLAERAVVRRLGESVWPVYLVPMTTAVVASGAAMIASQAIGVGAWQMAVIKAAICGLVIGAAVLAFDRAVALDAWRTVARAWKVE